MYDLIESVAQHGATFEQLNTLKEWALKASKEELAKAKKVAQRGYNRWTADKPRLSGKECPLVKFL